LQTSHKLIRGRDNFPNEIGKIHGKRMPWEALVCASRLILESNSRGKNHPQHLLKKHAVCTTNIQFELHSLACSTLSYCRVRHASSRHARHIRDTALRRAHSPATRHLSAWAASVSSSVPSLSSLPS
jgi:hypothetical protein